MAPATSSDYRLSPALGARLMGLMLVVLALLLFAVTALVALLHGPPDLLVVLAVVGVVGVFGTGYALTRRPVVRLDEEGYRVRLIRGAGVHAARWKEVSDASTADARGLACVVLQLTDGRTTTIPMAALAADRDDFVRDLRDHLARGQGLRPL